MFRRLGVMAVCALMLASCAAEEQSTPAGRSSSAGVEPMREEPVFDVADLDALQDVWWTWVASVPQERDPLTDVIGERCANNQPEGVWLVAGSAGLPVERRCSVPAGVPIAGPAVNFLGGSGSSECDDFMTDAAGEVTLNGDVVPLKALDFAVIDIAAAVEGNSVTGTSGENSAFGCGLWFSVPGLEPGEHVLEIRGSSGDLVLTATYKLTVSATP